MFTKLKQAPVSVLLVGCALLAFVVPGANEVLQLDFARVAEGELWRIVTGHWTHFGASHLVWDLLMFVILAIACEVKAGKWFGPAVGLMTVFCSAAVAITCSHITIFRGLSGLDTGLFTWFVASQVGASALRKDCTSGVLYFAMLVGLLGKLAFEAITGGTLFVEEGDFQPLVQVHIAGAIAGLIYSVTPTIYRWSSSWASHLWVSQWLARLVAVRSRVVTFFGGSRSVHW